jgi:hypothetical protein
MKSAVAPLTLSRNSRFYWVCSTSQKSACFSRLRKCEKRPIFLGLLHLATWSRASGAKPICSTAPLAPPPFRVGARWSGANMPSPWSRSFDEVLPRTVSPDSKFEQAGARLRSFTGGAL